MSQNFVGALCSLFWRESHRMSFPNPSAFSSVCSTSFCEIGEPGWSCSLKGRMTDLSPGPLRITRTQFPFHRLLGDRLRRCSDPPNTSIVGRRPDWNLVQVFMCGVTTKKPQLKLWCFSRLNHQVAQEKKRLEEANIEERFRKEQIPTPKRCSKSCPLDLVFLKIPVDLSFSQVFESGTLALSLESRGRIKKTRSF